MKAIASIRARFITLMASLWLMYPLAEAMASIGPFGGIINSIVLDPADSNTVYAATQSGGVFKSTNGGGQWAAVNTGLINLFVLSLAINPAAPNTVYACTSSGIFASYNGGQTWN